MFNNTIRKLASLFLIAVFVLCNAPTPLLHSLFANHKDQRTQVNFHYDKPMISVAGINCHCVGNVTTAPFMPGHLELSTTSSLVFPDYQKIGPFKILLSFIPLSALRAPPGYV